MRRRLATQIHLTVVAVLVLFTVLVTAAWWLGPGERQEQALVAGLAVTAGELLPGPDRPVAELQAAVGRLGARFGVDMAVFAPGGRRLAAHGAPPAAPFDRDQPSGWRRPHRRGLIVSLRLPDGRLVVAGHSRPDPRHLAGFVLILAILALAVGIGAGPLVRRLTRRLERLRGRVEDLGRGDLSARAPVEGTDEVADLARSFNRAADRIQQLVEAERRRLAFASHELRSPLARLRVSLEMMTGDATLKQRAARDVGELDSLIDELLESSRLEARGPIERGETLDLLALVAEEAARAGTEVEGEPVSCTGDPRLLRRLVRNLLDNARHHGGAAPIEARVERGPGGSARLRVADRGPGVPEAERERIFEPFHRPPGTPETGQGFGLGLALVRQIARAHGGEARCLPRAGGGMVFEVDLGV